MIVNSENPKVQPAKQTVNHPSYGSDQSYPGSSQPYPSQQPIHLYVGDPHPRQSSGLRFCRALMIAILIWFILSILVRSMVELANTYHGNFDESYSIPSDITLSQCVSDSQWSTASWSPAADAVPPLSFPYTAEASFDLLLSSDTLFLIARGPLSAGTVNVVTSPEPSDVARVNVKVHYFREDIRNSAQVCLVKRGENENGVGIFSWWGRRGREERLYFETTITLPESSKIAAFETDVPNTSQRLGDLRDKVDFKSISLKGSNALIRAQSLYADHADITTSNGPIEGWFNTSSRLHLQTSNAAINVKVGLENDAKGSGTELIMQTSNGQIDSVIHLVSTSSSGGTFLTTARTSNKGLQVTFPTAPTDSTLHLLAVTSNGPAHVALHPTYEGKFAISTSNKNPEVRVKEVDDPAGEGRKRDVDWRKAGKSIEGTIHWNAEEGGAKGDVRVRTSNSPVVLEL